jgi:hypothetical protein
MRQLLEGANLHHFLCFSNFFSFFYKSLIKNVVYRLISRLEIASFFLNSHPLVNITISLRIVKAVFST